ncbi:MAG: DUF4349 domain-containing protein [Candidatus Peregrinibacteria bacterium]
MKKVLLWIVGIILVLVAIVIVLVIVSESSPLDTRISISQDYGFDGSFPAKEMANVRSPSAAQWGEADDSASGQGQVGERIVIRSARLAIVSKDVQKAAEELKGYAQANGGFVVSADVRSEEGEAPTAQVSFRIPADKLDAAVAFVRSQALRVTSESITGEDEDVTEEYVDLTARLHNLTASETQLLAIMKDARKTEDVLAVHREIERVRAQIESLTGRKKYLDESAKLSFVTVSIATDESSLPVIESGNEWRPLVVAKGAVTAFLGVLKFLANLAIWIIIFVPVWGTAILVVRYWKRRRPMGQ